MATRFTRRRLLAALPAVPLILAGRTARKAWRSVRTENLGEVVLVRAFEPPPGKHRAALIELLRSAFDGAAPQSVSVEGAMVTWRYPRAVASYECRAGSDVGLVFYGTRATLVIDPRYSL